MWPWPDTRIPAPGDMKFTIFGRLGQHCHTLSLSDLCLGLEKRILKEIMHFLYHLYGHTLAQEPLPRGGGVIKFIILVGPSLVIITMNLICLNHAPE